MRSTAIRRGGSASGEASANRVTREAGSATSPIGRTPLADEFERLAALADCRHSTSIRAFRAATGLTPHRVAQPPNRPRQGAARHDAGCWSPRSATPSASRASARSARCSGSSPAKHPRATDRSGVAHPPSRGATSAMYRRISNFEKRAARPPDTLPLRLRKIPPMIQRMSHVTLFVNNQQENERILRRQAFGFEGTPARPRWTAASDG